MTIAVDFDGVIHAYSKGWQDGTIYDPPIPGALDGLRTLMATHAVFIFTTRNAESVAGWLRVRDIPARTEREMAADGEPVSMFWDRRDIALVTHRKLAAVAYLDDRAVRFTDWDQALAQLLPTGDAPADQLPPYSGDKPTCLKCGSEGAFTEYRAHGKCLHDRTGGVLGFAPNERLHRRCTRCDYAWDEATVISGPAGCGPECSEMHTETGRCEIAMARRESRAAGPSDDASAECRSCEHPRHAPGECTEQLDGDDCTCQEEN